MSFFEFLDSVFISKNIQMQKGYKPIFESEMHASQALIHAQKVFLKWVMVPKLVFQFIFMKLHLVAQPKSKEELIEGLKKEAEEKKAARESAKLAAVPDAPNPA